MKNLIRLFSKVFKSNKQDEVVEVEMELSEGQLDAWIVSIRQKPQFSNISCTAYLNHVQSNDDLEAAGNLVLA